jgi:dimethylhistidine N-methyltransferase
VTHVSGGVRLEGHRPAELNDVDEVLAGLRSSPKTLPCRLFYDERGSELFEEICALDEYYLTRTELAIMRRHIGEMGRLLGPRCAVIEYGSGAGIKSRILLEALEAPVAYIPIDISRSALLASCERLAEAFPEVEVLPVWGDYAQTINLPRPETAPDRAVVFFPGSTIGNFHPGDAESFLRRSARLVGAGGAMLIGVDLRKSRRVLEAAYDDARGVTAAFNLNILRRINREMGADFDVDRFRHRAIWNDAESRIEMYLVSEVRQDVRLDGATVRIGRGEAILTEVSYKYDPAVFERIVRRAGFAAERAWQDEGGLFSVQYLVAG